MTRIQTDFLHRIQPHVEQRFIKVKHDDRAEKLLQVVKSSQKNKMPTIIFRYCYLCYLFINLMFFIWSPPSLIELTLQKKSQSKG